MNKTHVKISLKIWHPEKSWKEISDSLKMEAVHKWNANEEVRHEGAGLKQIRKKTYCVFLLLDEKKCYVDDVLEKALENLNEQRENFHDIVSSGGRLELFIGVFVDKNTGYTLEQKVFLMLVDLKLQISFDLYGQKEGISEN